MTTIAFDMTFDNRYMAGVVDSDGSFSLVKRKKQSTVHGYHYRTIFQLTWKDTPIVEKTMEEMVKDYGGGFCPCKATGGGRVLKYSIEGFLI